MSQRELKIEVGKKYKDGANKTVTINECLWLDWNHYPFVGHDEYGRRGTYTQDGRNQIDNPTEHDLIEEVKE